MLKNRIRRLCTTCRTVPVSYHLAPVSPPHTPHSHNHSHPQSREPTPPLVDPSSFTAPAFLRTPCTCDQAVWLCHQCGHTVRATDTTYRRVWAWRTRYSTYLGGLGTGIGEGCQGVKCGRGEDCLAAHETELEVVSEADEDALASDNLHNHHGLSSPAYNNTNTNNRTNASATPDEEEPGYFRQEIIGIGGRFKQKIKKRVLVGACVVEHEDERDSGNYLTREEQGLDRAWCGWCWRVIASKEDSSFGVSMEYPCS